MWSHCSYVNMFFQQSSIKSQCGDANWYFFGFDSNCYWNNGGLPITYCVKLMPTNTSVRAVQSGKSYDYNITVSLFNNRAAFYSDLNRTSAAFPMIGSDGNNYGNETVESVSGADTQSYDSHVILNTTASRWQTNTSDYSTYQQALNNLDSVMSYYNNTSGNLDAIREAMSAFNSTALRLIEMDHVFNTDGCSIMVQGPEWHYSCKPPSPLYYNIDARLNPGSTVNQLISVQGSTINVT